MAAKQGITLVAQCKIAAALETLREAQAVLGGLEAFDGEEDDSGVTETMIQLGRVAYRLLCEVQGGLAKLTDMDAEVAGVLREAARRGEARHV